MSGQRVYGCYVCPRACGVDRSTKVGVCGAGDKARIAKIVDPFYYEEPCLGELSAVFFSGCPLRCSYCQNVAISRAAVGQEYTDEQLAEVFDGIAGNNRAIDLVTPTHYLDQIERAAKLCKNASRFIYNTSGYETENGVERASKFSDVFLTDFKYGEEDTAARLSSARDYPTVAVKALVKMRYALADEWIDNGTGERTLKRGLVVRHLVLPGEVKSSLTALDMIKSAIGTDVTISIMSQFTPNGAGEPSRRLKKIEYKLICEHAMKLGFTNGYFQDFDSASTKYTPDFD